MVKIIHEKFVRLIHARIFFDVLIWCLEEENNAFLKMSIHVIPCFQSMYKNIHRVVDQFLGCEN